MTAGDHPGAERTRDVDRILAGERAADGLLKMLRVACTTGDELHAVLGRLINDELALKSFAREVQKALERASV
jgi:hypothetical protein